MEEEEAGQSLGRRLGPSGRLVDITSDPRSSTMRPVEPETNPHIEDFLGISGLFVIAELLIFGRFGEYGLAVHVLSMLLLFALIYRSNDVAARLYQSMVLVPLLRIFNFGIPMITDNSLFILGILYTFLLISVFQVQRSQGLSLVDIGFAVGKIRLGVLGLGVGLVFGLVQYGFALEGLEYEPTLTNYLLVILTAGVLIGLVEELIFRGLIQRWAAVLYDDWIAIFMTSVIFAFMHSIWLNPADILFAGLASLLIGWIYAKYNNMWFIVGLHGMINVSAFLLYPVFLPGL